MTNIIQILNNRVTYITLLFAAFGGALSFLLKIEDMKTYYPALASLIALVISLLVSLLIQGKKDRKRMQRIKLSAVILFILFLGFAAVHTKYVITKTFEYHEFDALNRYVKGNYSDTALALQKRFPQLTDEQILYQKMSGVDSIKHYWTSESVDSNIFMLIVTYCLLVLCFVASVTLMTEVLAERSKRDIPVKKGKIIPIPSPPAVEPEQKN